MKIQSARPRFSRTLTAMLVLASMVLPRTCLLSEADNDNAGIFFSGSAPIVQYYNSISLIPIKVLNTFMSQSVSAHPDAQPVSGRKAKKADTSSGPAITPAGTSDLAKQLTRDKNTSDPGEQFVYGGGIIRSQISRHIPAGMASVFLVLSALFMILRPRGSIDDYIKMAGARFKNPISRKTDWVFSLGGRNV